MRAEGTTSMKRGCVILFKALKYPWKQLPLLLSCDKKKLHSDQLEFHKTVYNKKHHNFVFNKFALQQKKKRNHLGGEKKGKQTQKEEEKEVLKNFIPRVKGWRGLSLLLNRDNIFQSIFPFYYSFPGPHSLNPSRGKKEWKIMQFGNSKTRKRIMN